MQKLKIHKFPWILGTDLNLFALTFKYEQWNTQPRLFKFERASSTYIALKIGTSLYFYHSITACVINFGVEQECYDTKSNLIIMFNSSPQQLTATS